MDKTRYFNVVYKRDNNNLELSMIKATSREEAIKRLCYAIKLDRSNVVDCYLKDS